MFEIYACHRIRNKKIRGLLKCLSISWSSVCCWWLPTVERRPMPGRPKRSQLSNSVTNVLLRTNALFNIGSLRRSTAEASRLLSRCSNPVALHVSIPADLTKPSRRMSCCYCSHSVKWSNGWQCSLHLENSRFSALKLFWVSCAVMLCSSLARFPFIDRMFYSGFWSCQNVWHLQLVKGGSRTDHLVCSTIL